MLSLALNDSIINGISFNSGALGALCLGNKSLILCSAVDALCTWNIARSAPIIPGICGRCFRKPRVCWTVAAIFIHLVERVKDTRFEKGSKGVAELCPPFSQNKINAD